jgi:flagellar biosynthesis/type III secretory pathway M-ring protein FliF/YscJ
MAEEEFNLDDDLGDFGEEDTIDSGGDLPDGITNARNDVSPKSGALSSRNKIVIGSIVGVVFFIGAFLFGMRLFDGDDTQTTTNAESIHSSQNLSTNKKNTVPPKKKKKKKVKYVQLFSKVDGDNTALILKELSFSDISFKTSQNGQNFAIEVDEEDIIKARNLLAIKQLPSSKPRGYELLDDAQTLGVTEFDKRIRFLRALSGELEKAITQFSLVEDAKVQIVLPEQRLFAVTQPPVTSSILIRRSYGSDLTDEIVFSIIQLVSNAVENLQQENVSVIDTAGIVLSEGIFERMAAKRLGIEEEEEEDLGDPRENAKGQPVVPNFVRIKEWFEIKWQFEKMLIERTTKQLLGVLPLGSFKVAMTTDIGAIENGEIAEVKRLTISVVVDNLNEEVVLDANTKRQIFATVSGATGYVKGRDTIQLTRADFTLLTDEEIKALELLRDGESSAGLLSWVLGILGGLLVMVIGFFGFKFIRNRKRKESDDIIETDRDADFSDIQEELEGEKNIDKVKQLSVSNPEWVAKVMENWLSSDSSGNIESVPVLDEEPI